VIDPLTLDPWAIDRMSHATLIDLHGSIGAAMADKSVPLSQDEHLKLLNMQEHVAEWLAFYGGDTPFAPPLTDCGACGGHGFQAFDCPDCGR
jgi:hypothetical protein